LAIVLAAFHNKDRINHYDENRSHILIIPELVNDGTIIRQQEATADNPEEK
jgi:hypothetical protein